MIGHHSYVAGSPMKLLAKVSIAVSLSTSGCGLFGGLRVDSVATSIQKPSNVAFYVSVRHGDHAALGLFEKNFLISEDGKDLSTEETRQTLLPRDMAAVHRALLLVDMSGPIADGDTRQRIAEAVARFVSRAHVAEPVTVYAFDGGAALHLVGEYPQGTEEITDVPALATYSPSDPSSNLDGAVIEAMTQLDARLMMAEKPVRVGSLIVFARGPDLAGRVPESKMRDALDESKALVFAISIKDTPGFRASRIGRDGAFEAESSESILHAFDNAGGRVAEAVGRYYLLSYCTPARAGMRHVRIEVVTNDDEGKQISGTMSADFDASGFTSGCDPTQRPRFVVQPDPEAHDRGASRATQPEDRTRKPSAPKSATPAPDDGDGVVPPPSKPGYAQ